MMNVRIKEVDPSIWFTNQEHQQQQKKKELDIEDSGYWFSPLYPQSSQLEPPLVECGGRWDPVIDPTPIMIPDQRSPYSQFMRIHENDLIEFHKKEVEDALLSRLEAYTHAKNKQQPTLFLFRK